jgi:aspartate carbamoyltransferase regulatory subunit
MVNMKDISKLPDEFQGIFKCVYETCITNKEREPITTKFVVITRTPLCLQCKYCGRYNVLDQLKDQIDG